MPSIDVFVPGTDQAVSPLNPTTFAGSLLERPPTSAACTSPPVRICPWCTSRLFRYQLRNYVSFITFLFVAVAIGFFAILAQLIAIPQLLPPMVISANKDQSRGFDFDGVAFAINAAAGILMVIASRVLPVLVVLIGEGFPTVSNRDNVTNNYLRTLVVLWTVFCVSTVILCYVCVFAS